MALTYGKTTPTAYSDPEVVAVNLCSSRFGEAMRPGAYLVDTYPILRYIPGCLTQLRKWHLEELALYEGQLNLVREQMVNISCIVGLPPEADYGQRKGDARPCFAKFLLENQESYGIADKEMAYVAGSIFGAGADTVGTKTKTSVLRLYRTADLIFLVARPRRRSQS